MNLLRTLYRRVNGKSNFKVIDENWYFLIILDACRFDYFRNVNNILGKLSKINSIVTNTQSQLRRNFTDEYPNIINISANPHITPRNTEYTFDGSIFHSVESIWLNNWNKKYQTILPQDVVKKAIEVHKKKPGKRKIVHFLQPH